jgi:hypothetical protein
MVGSLTMLRSIAGAYYRLTSGKEGDAMTRSELEAFLRGLAVRMREIPVTETGPWVATGAFQVGASAPGGAAGYVRALTDTLVSWARSGEIDV